MDLRAASLAGPPGHLAGWARLSALIWQEEVPEVDPPAAPESLDDLYSDEESQRGGLVALDGDVVVGVVGWGLPQLENREFAFGWLFVDPVYRRRGIGRTLFDAATTELRDMGRRRFGLNAVVDSPGAAFAAALGATFEQVDLPGVLDVTALDHDDVDGLANDVAVGYHLVRWRDHCPGELVDAFAVARASMNDAPRGESMPDDWVWSARRVRALEARRRRWGARTYTASAVHEPSGGVAGFTEIVVPGRPHTALQEDTGVLRAHRGHQLGLAMKAANLRWLIRKEPSIERICTWNAEDNRHMRSVNERLGFRAGLRTWDLSFEL